MTASDTITFTAFHTRGMPGETRSSQVPRAASAALTASETSNKKPIATMRPKERTRSIMNALKVALFGFGFTRQMVFRAV